MKPASEVENILASFSYPLCNEGGILLLAVGVVSLLLQLLQHAIIFIPHGEAIVAILKLILCGAIVGYALHIITKTADGEDTPPNWQSIGGWGDLLQPMILLLVTVGFSFGPAIGWSIALHYGYVEMRPVFWILLLWGCFYFPMALTAVAMMDDLFSLNPVKVLVSIFQTGWVYLYACITLLIAVASYWFITSLLPRVPIITNILVFVLQTYLLMVTGRVCGLIYRLRREKLNWLCE